MGAIDGVVCEVDDITDGSRHGHVIEAESWHDEGRSGAAAERFAAARPGDRRLNACLREAPRPARIVRPGGAGEAVVETHLSTVVFDGDLVHKRKKPVRFPFVDLSTLTSVREQVCQREVELNRRFCPDVYLGVEDIVDDAVVWSTTPC